MRSHLKSSGAASIMRSSSRLSVSTRARLGGTVGQLVSDPLQPAEVEDSWDGRGGGDATLDLNPAEPLRDQPGELALEATDLTAQLMARQALVDPYARKAVSVEQFRHRPSRPV